MQQEKWNARTAGAITHDTPYYIKCLFGGVLACGLTHTAVTPLDVVKCNMQTNPAKYNGLVSGMRTVIAEEGSGALVKGWMPALFGYCAQGMFKFGLNEIFKDSYANMLGEENSTKYRGLVWAAGRSSAD